MQLLCAFLAFCSAQMLTAHQPKEPIDKGHLLPNCGSFYLKLTRLLHLSLGASRYMSVGWPTDRIGERPNLFCQVRREFACVCLFVRLATQPDRSDDAAGRLPVAHCTCILQLWLLLPLLLLPLPNLFYPPPPPSPFEYEKESTQM